MQKLFVFLSLQLRRLCMQSVTLKMHIFYRIIIKVDFIIYC